MISHFTSLRFRALTTRALIAFCVALTVITMALPAHAAKRLELRQKIFTAQKEQILIRGFRPVKKIGAFGFSPNATVDGPDTNRTIFDIGATISPGFAENQFDVVAEGIFRRKKLVTEHIGKTRITIEFIEVKRGTKTLALSKPTVKNNTFDYEGAMAIPLQLHVGDWKDIEIRYHVKLDLLNDEGNVLRQVPGGARKTIRWKPSLFTFNISSPLAPGTPPHPGFLRPMGIGLVPSPRKPVIGDTFSTFVMLQNTGDLPTDTMLVMWKYGLNTKISYQAPVEKGRRIKLRFLARASNNAQTVRLTLGDSVFQVKVLPVAKSNVTITSLDLKGNYAEEPLEISIGFFNKGSAPGKELELLFRTPTGETRVRLNTIRPAANAVHTLSWDSMTNDSFPLRIILYENAQELDSRLLHVSRTAKPRSDIILSNIAFLGGRISGAPAVFTVTIENRGNLSGLADITLDVRNPQTGKFVARKRSKRKIAAGKKTVVSTQEFALPGGLIRGEVTVAGRTEFRILDAQPFTYFPQDDENVILPSNASRFKGNIIPLKKNLSFRFPKIADISEIDSRASLIIPIRIWPSGASTSKRSSKKNKDIRVTVKPSRGASKVFIIESTDNDTSFTFNLSTQMIQKGAKVSISKKTPATVFLRGVPRFSVSLSAPENGKILSTNASDSGVSIRLKNVAKLILSNRVTLSWGYSGSEMKTKAFSLERNQMKDVFLPIRSTSAGSKKIEIELSRSPGAPRYTVNQFVLPDVIPEFELHQPIYTRHVNNGKYGIMGFLNLNGPDAIEVEISGLKRKGSSKYRTTSDTIFYNRLTEIQTAAFFMPHSEDVYLSYGSINQIASASKGKVPKVHLDILDLGGDTLILGKPGLIRYRRYADKKALPETVLYLAVNGIISTAVAIPEVLKGHVYISAIPFIPPAADSIHIMLFEKMKAQTGLNTGKTDVGIMTTARYTIGTSASLGSPSRLDWDWTRPVIIPFKDTMVFTTVYERLAEAARRAEYQLGPRNKTSDAPLSTATVLGLQTSAPDTGISARIRYRKLLRDFVLEWESAYLILSGDRLPITLSTEDVQKFHIQIEKLTEIVQTPTSVDRKMTETHLTEFAKLLEAILGMKVNRNFLTL